MFNFSRDRVSEIPIHGTLVFLFLCSQRQPWSDGRSFDVASGQFHRNGMIYHRSLGWNVDR